MLYYWTVTFSTLLKGNTCYTTAWKVTIAVLLEGNTGWKHFFPAFQGITLLTTALTTQHYSPFGDANLLKLQSSEKSYKSIIHTEMK